MDMEEKVAGLRAAAKENKRKNNQKFLILAIICCVYFVVPSGIVIVSATLFLLWIFYRIRKQKQERVETFKAKQNQFAGEFWSWTRMRISTSGPVQCACGYLEGPDGFRDVSVFGCEGRVYVTGLVFRKNFVYAENNEFWYLFSMDEEGDASFLSADAGEMRPEKLSENHQDFLRRKGMQWENLNIVEGYIYNRFVRQMQDGSLVGRIAMDDGIDSLRKESLYSVNMPGGETLYLTEEALSMLGVGGTRAGF